ncbi:Crp/Fnr family transcriptional regulator [Oceanibacterium hippocampi]|uniref:cAMP receptor protein n=1 Tax=Oceanibacterium hippocampi TaxID=745714 RepID=A0A1Y5T9B2_9PROT|nr:Crp/Fnr family transcriptional regulator [Oceanibacterium hippocampi]SLN58802.1 cAMP receptor protein [Oceanibacterium hippocampi]
MIPTLDDRQKLFRRHFLFSDVAEETLERLAGLSTVVPLKRGDVLFYRGDEGDALYAVYEGTVRISIVGPDGKEVSLNLMEPGDFFGEIALLDGLSRTADARAAEDTTLVRLPREPFMALLDDEPRIMRNIIDMLCEMLRNSAEDIADAAFLDLRARLAKWLLELGISHGETTESGTFIRLRQSQTDLAQLLGVTREAVNKQLKSLEREHMIRLERGHITVLSRAKLLAIANPDSDPDRTAR